MRGGIRKPAVAGMFYPADPGELAREVDALLEDARRRLRSEERASRSQPKALIVPHAGYVYSGATAARAYARVIPAAGSISRVVLFGPAHRAPVAGLALPRNTVFRTPLGDVPIGVFDASGLPQVEVSDRAHAQEHSLEVQLPFLQRALGEFELVPFVVGGAGAAEVSAVVERSWGGPETLLVFSSDLSHYHSYADAQRLDAETVERMLTFDGPLDPRRACGAHPVNGLLLSAARRGLSSELLDLCNSGDTAGDKDRVVGYASIGVG